MVTTLLWCSASIFSSFAYLERDFVKRDFFFFLSSGHSTWPALNLPGIQWALVWGFQCIRNLFKTKQGASAVTNLLKGARPSPPLPQSHLQLVPSQQGPGTGILWEHFKKKKKKVIFRVVGWFVFQLKCRNLFKIIIHTDLPKCCKLEQVQGRHNLNSTAIKTHTFIDGGSLKICDNYFLFYLEA